MKKIFGTVVGALALVLLSASAADAQATRTWVSGVGDDVNPCSRTAPCKTFAGAISKTAAGGVINVLDPGSYGALTITKAITVQNEGSFAGVLFTSGFNGITVNAAATDVVVLRGLSFEGAGSGGSAIRFLNGLALHVENCDINRGVQKGIDFQPSATSLLTVKDTVIRNFNSGGTGGGIFIKPGATGAANVFLDNVRIERSLFGVRAEDRSNVMATNTHAVRNTDNGFHAISTAGGTVTINLDRSSSTLNLGGGIRSEGAAATVRIGNTLIAGNTNGLVSASGAIISFGNNNNADNGSPTSTIGTD
ncbi:MAG TPA: right-handed parallel beta-helix repeat-containing protein [Thermoanaerobaculia bacterium]|nr:right-handed parallel beta-helix repeat-containing protein [Thermoanaerobaculia bacterium]